MSDSKVSENSTSVREQVINAQEIQTTRFTNLTGIYNNSQMGSKLLKEVRVISTVDQSLLKIAIKRLNLSAHAYDRMLKVSRTIADMAGSEDIKPEHLAEAI